MTKILTALTFAVALGLSLSAVSAAPADRTDNHLPVYDINQAR